MIEKIKAACEPLRHFPLSAPLREHLTPGLRVTFASNYAIYYLYNELELVIVRVLHGAGDAAALAAQGGFQQGDA